MSKSFLTQHILESYFHAFYINMQKLPTPIITMYSFLSWLFVIEKECLAQKQVHRLYFLRYVHYTSKKLVAKLKMRKMSGNAFFKPSKARKFIFS